MKPIFDERDVNIDDIAILEHLFLTRNTVADNVVDGSTDRFGESTIIKRCRNGILYVQRVVVADTVKFSCADTGLNILLDHFELLCGKRADNAHFLDIFRGF